MRQGKGCMFEQERGGVLLGQKVILVNRIMMMIFLALSSVVL